jgi:oxygen-independent coproporphyrinogen-3 oxidase
LIAGGAKYHAHSVPDEELTADLYEAACERLNAAGIAQYEISNFAKEGCESRHNLKYWTRQPYLGFGVDAHSMLLSATGEFDAVRFSSSDSLEQYVAGTAWNRTEVSRQAALEESFFLSLRLNRGVDLACTRERFGERPIDGLSPLLTELVSAGLIERQRDILKLSARGRLLSNEVFERFLSCDADTPAR